MRIPGSFTLAYWEEEATGKRLKDLAGKRLQKLCSENSWLFDHRVKGQESAFAKLQLSGFKRISDIHDFYAATIVVPTPAELGAAVKVLKDDLGTVKVVQRRVGDPRTFSYDDTHVLATLGDKAPGLATALTARVFEIQVRTGLQYAWWRATHDMVYKGGERSWRLGRLASQIRASLELSDILLADLRKAARLRSEKKTAEDKAFGAVLGSLERWPEDRRPKDVLRYFNEIGEVAKATNRTEREIVALLDGSEGQRLTGEVEVTPFQAVLGAIVDADGPGVVSKLAPKRYVLLNKEFLAACPAAAGVSAGRRVDL